MDKKVWIEKAQAHLQVLCSDIKERRVGSEGNRQATAYAKKKLNEFGWQTEETELSVIDWKTEGATLTCNSQSFEVFSSHYSLGCSVEAILVAVDSVEKLEKTDIKDKIVLLFGEISSQQIAPKKFPFWNPVEHQHLISLLEQGSPKALICATERNSATAGGVYPFPLFEDGDFDIPSVYMKDTEGEELLACVGHTVKLVSECERIPETASNIIGRKNTEVTRRIVLSAHIDAKIGTSGAIDNATGVTVLLLVAELLSEYAGNNQIELAVFNGEDYYAASGQVKYVEQNANRFDDILLNINIDGVGYKEGNSCFSAFGLSSDIQHALEDIIHNNACIEMGEPWYQGDHSLFIQNGCQAIAVSSQWLIENMECQDVTHTSKDNLDIVNYDRVVESALAIVELLRLIPS